MTKPVRLALIGTGRWGSLIKKTLGTIPECQLVFEGARDWEVLLARTDIDGVIIATPPPTHSEIALSFIKRRVPVFVEKPMTMSVDEARKIEDGAKKNNTLVMVGHIHLYNPAFIVCRDLVQDCGPIRLLVGEGSSKNSLRADSSVLWDWAPHDIAMMLALLKEEPDTVTALAEAVVRPGTKLWDSVRIRLTYRSGAIGLISSTALLPEKRRRFTLVGEKKRLVFDDVAAENKVALYDGTSQLLQAIGFRSSSESAVSYPIYDSEAPLRRELREFLNVIETEKQSESDAKFGRRIVEIIAAAERSIDMGSIPVKID